MGLIAASLILALAIVGVWIDWTRRSGRLMRLRQRQTVIVTTKDGATYRGVLFDSDPQAIVLRNAEALNPQSDRPKVSVDGELLILRPDVAFLQRP